MKEFVSWNVIDEAVTDIAFHLKKTKNELYFDVLRREPQPRKP